MNLAKPSSRARRNLWIAGIALALFTITGFFILPPIIKTQLEKRLSAALGRTVTVGKVRINPYALSLTLENFDIRERDARRSFVGWDRLYVNFDALASLTGDWVLSEIELEGFHAGVTIAPDGAMNFADILAKVAAATPAPVPAAPAKPGRPIRIGSLKVVQARVDFADQSRKKPFATVVGPQTFALTEFRTAGSRGAPYHFEAVTESGEKFAWSGTISAEPFRSVGELKLENIVLAKYSPYYADLVQTDLADGKLSVRGRYEVNLTTGQRVLQLLDGAVQLRGLKLLERASQAVAVELPVLDITGINADALAQKATVASVLATGGHLQVRRAADGSINLLTMLQPPGGPSAAPATPAPAAAPAAPAKLPEFKIGEVALKDFQVDVSDQAAPRPAQLGVSAIQFSMKNVTLADGAVMPLQLALGWAPHGTVHLDGSVALKPLKADLKLDVAGLELLPLSPYLEQFANVHLTQGAVTTSLTVGMTQAEGRPPAINIAGDVKVDKFGVVDGAHNEELAGVGSLVLSGLQAGTAPLAVKVAEVDLTAPYARVVVNADKSLNLAAIARTGTKPAEAPAAAAPSPAPVAPAPKIEIGKVVITDGDYSFTDRSVEPNVHTAITQFGGTIAGLSSENLAKAAVDLKATVDGAGPVAITGQLDPLGAAKTADLKIDFRNVDLLPLSPYSAKYAGYELARGKLVIDAKFQLADNKIDATNVVTLNQFTFGGASNSPDATGLPVRLGVALLKDTDGKILIDLPIQGTVGDPNFRIGRVVMRVIVNLLTKVATSPFALLGSMFGGGGDELGYQEFAPGAAALQTAEVKKLETMVKALTNRPGLSVDLAGSYDGPADTYALKQQKFADTVRRAIWEAKHAVDPNIAPPAQIAVTPEENAAMVKQLFDAKFPPGTQFGVPLAAPPAVVAAPKEKKGFVARVVAVFSGKRSAEAKPAANGPVQPAAAGAAAGAAPAGPSLEEMGARLAETMEVNDNDLRALAQARAQQVRDYFINTGQINPERLFLAKEPADPAKAGKGPRVFLNLQ